MTPTELDNLRKALDTGESRKTPAIVSRRYDLIIRKDGEEVETIEYLTRRQVNELKAEYKSEGYTVDIIEAVSVDASGNEITFTKKAEHPITKGVGGFGTPTMSEKRIESRRIQRSQNGRRPKASDSKPVIVIKGERNPKSLLHKMYLEALKRYGYTVIDKRTGKRIFRGLQNETAEFIYRHIKLTKCQMSDLDIRFHGV
jgi:hypothetical protein